MCGFFGLIKKENDPHLADSFLCLESRQLVDQRGPDEQNQFTFDNAFFYHSKLSTMSSPAGARQPYPCFEPGMSNEQIMLFNGSIYNFKELDPNAESDTAVLYERMRSGSFRVESLNGSFSICYYNSSTQELRLLRDRLGIKSLFYVPLDDKGRVTEGVASELIFGTNLTPIIEILKRRGLAIEEDQESINQYLNFRYVRDLDKTFFKGIRQLAPGCSIQWKLGEVVSQTKYWEIDEFCEQQRPIGCSFFDQAQELLHSAISMRGVSSTPICSFLSGGLDSGVISSIGLQEGFIQKSFHLSLPGETNEVKRLNHFIGLYPHDNEILNFKTPSQSEAQRVFKNLEQPIGDSVIYLLDQLSAHASKEYKIALSGDGADELFGGYIHHRAFQVAQLFHKVFPSVLREGILKITSCLPLSFYNAFFPYNDNLSREGVDKLIKFLRSFDRPFKAYSYLVGLSNLAQEDSSMGGVPTKWQEMNSADFSLEKLLAFDLKFWGPGYSLYKLDRLSMGHGIEVRTPFYDHRLVELCLSHSFVNSRNIVQAKSGLKKLCSGMLADEVIAQKKFPFRVQDHYLDSSARKRGTLISGKRDTCLANLVTWRDS